MPQRERMSSVDTAWLRMDRPGNLMMIVGVLLLEGKVEFDRVARVMEERLLAYERFRQRPVADATGWYWETDRRFRLDHHLRRARLPRGGGPDVLKRFVARLAARPLDPRHPRWQFHLVEEYDGGGALIVRIHHCYADGMALVGVMLDLTDATAESAHRGATVDEESAGKRGGSGGGLLEPVSDLLQVALKRSGDLAAKGFTLLRHPDQLVHYAGAAANVAAEIADLATMPDDTHTRFKGEAGVAKAVAWAEPIPLEEVKAVGRALGCSVNDVLLSCAAGALRGYLREKGDPTAGVELRAMVPVNLRPPGRIEKLGNQFGLVTLLLPVGIVNPLARVQEVHARMEALKTSYQPLVAYGILALAGVVPHAVQKQGLDLLANKATAVMTNVPGPQELLYLAGCRIRNLMFWVPQSGDIGMGASILSYGGGVHFGLITDAGRVPDPDRIVERFRPEFERLLLALLMEPWGEVRDPHLVERELERTAGVSPPSRTSRARRRGAPSRPRASP